MTTPLLSIFKQYKPEGALYRTAESLSIAFLEGDRASRCITAHAESSAEPESEHIRQIEENIRSLYGLECFSIKLEHPETELDEKLLTELFLKLKAETPTVNGFLCNAACDIDRVRGRVTITLEGEGREFLTGLDCGRRLEKLIEGRCGAKVTVNFVDGKKAAAKIDKAAVIERLMAEAPKPEKALEKPKNAKVLPEGTIMGNYKQTPVTPMSDLNLDMSNVTVCGEVFFAEHKNITTKPRENIPSRELGIICFDMTDRTGSVRVSCSMAVNKAKPVQDAIKPGKYLTVQGQLIYNNFEREMVIKPKAIVESVPEIRRDNAKEKRVELHLHTNMSAMDGMSSAESLVYRAAYWGHKAVAITDHGAAQAFPEAMNAAKKSDIKIIYGIEAYYVNDSGGGITGIESCPIDGEIVVVDIETTGLKAAQDSIIEIGAVLIRGGEIIDRFSTFVNPGCLIPENIVALTGITDLMVRDAPPIEDALPRFIEFAGGRPLAAHNADFDVGFIGNYCEKLGIPRPSTYIDTLQLSRILLPDQRKHKLDAVADALGFGDFNHHRACDDAEVTGMILNEFLKRLKAMGANDIQDIPRIVHDMHSDVLGAYNHLIILVRNAVGLKNLYKLISASNLKYFKKKPIMPKSLIDQFREGLIIGSACEAGELFRAITLHKSWGELCKIASWYDYLEIQPIGNNMFMIAKGTAKDEEELRDFNRTVIRLGQSTKKPVVATGDVHFLDPSDEIYRRILMAGQGFSDADQQAPLYFKTTDEMLDEFSYLGAKKAHEIVITNPNAIADSCDVLRPVPEGTYPPSIDGSAEELEHICRTKAKEIYGDPLPKIVADRLDAELKPIISNGYDVMYSIAQKLVSKSTAAGYLVGSRGSVGSSVVAYFTGITEVNALAPHYICDHCHNSEFFENSEYGCGADMPDKNCPVCGKKYRKDGFNIPFFTFLGFDADKQPDIDLNFSGEYQSRAHRDTVELFGQDHVFRAGTIGTIASKTAYGYVKKYMEERGFNWSKAEINRLTVGCTGVKRTTGQHPGGLVVVPREKEVYDFCPVQHPADDMKTDIITTHFDYNSMHENLLKLDLLGHDDPTMLHMLGENTGVDVRSIPLDDPDTLAIFHTIKPLGIEPDDILGTTGAVAVPEFGTRNARSMLIDTKPSSFDELVRISGLSHGTDVWHGNAADLVKSGDATLRDVICARDDITMFLISKGVSPKISFTTSEGVRKGRGLKPEQEEEMRSHGVPDWYITSCKKIKYLYPKAHAVAYVMMAFRIAYFKVHYPLDFYSAYFTIRAVGFDGSTMVGGLNSVKQLYLSLKNKEDATVAEKDAVTTLEVCYEFNKRGLNFHPVDIYLSDAEKFIIDREHNALIPPLISLPGLGLSAAQDIMRERENGKFSSAEELKMRCSKVSSSIIDLLDKTGALGSLPKSDQISMFDM